MSTEMTETDALDEPEWDTPLAINLTPGAIIHALYWSADTVHTGRESCVEQSLVIHELNAVEEESDNHCRLVEQEYVEEEGSDLTWHDWTVEVKLAGTYVTGHWRTQVSASPADWEWCAEQAETAFASGCVLLGKRVRKGLVVEEEPPETRRAPRTRH